MIGDKVFTGYEMASYDALPIPLYMYGNVIGLDTDGYKSIIQVEWENGTITKGPGLPGLNPARLETSNCRQDRKGRGSKR